MAERIIQKDLASAVAPRYKSYGLYVVKDRALPSLYSGCKPVLQRSLYSMYEMGLKHTSKIKKSARIVGDVIGKYHPHGDTSVYEAIVRASQDWNMRYPLVDMPSNNGSIDGDGAAAMRYTEARLSAYGEELLSGINKNTVDFKPNYDNTEREPVELPAMLPNLLANGVEGIAVGMATNIPPHNLTELLTAAKTIISNVKEEKETTLDEIMTIIQGPDFPGGGTIVNKKHLKAAFATGVGKITLRGKAEIVEDKKGNKSIVITEIPYQVKPVDLISKITSLAKDGKVEGIKEVEDESAKDICIVVRLKKAVNANLVLNQLYKLTDLQKNINYNMNALMGEEPVGVTLMDYLNEYLSNSLNILLKRTQFDYEKDSKRLLNLQTIFVYLENKEDIVKIIANSDTPEQELADNYELSEEQVSFLLNTRLGSIKKSNIAKYEEEYNALNENIVEYTKILEDEEYALDILSKELSELQDRFGDERRTNIELTNGEITDEDLIKDEPLVVTITSDGLIKSVDEKEYTTQKRGGKGTSAASTKDDEIVTDLFSINSKDDILFMTNTGRCHKLKGYTIPKVSKTAKGRHINNFIKLEENEEIVSVMSLRVKDEADSSIVFITALGQIKRLAVKELGSRYSAIRVLTIKDGDALQTCLKVNEGQDIMLCTAKGLSTRFTISTETKKPVKTQGRTAAGVMGIKVAENDYVIGGTVIDDDTNVLTLTANGLAKQTKGASWEAKQRAGKGMICHKVTEKTGDLVSVLAVKEEDEIFVGTESGKIIRLKANSIATSGRAAIGSKAIKLGENDFAFTASLAPVTLEEEKNEEEA